VLLAVDPAGRASLVGNQDSTTATVVVYELTGKLLDTRSMHASLEGAVGVNSIAVAADHTTVLGGVLTGQTDFGFGTVVSRGHEGYIVNLGP
jgi:hypothetical protein